MQLKVGWARSSTCQEEMGQQIEELKAAGCIYIHGVQPSATYAETNLALAKMLDELRVGDQVIVTKIDRLGRSLRQVLKAISDIEKIGATIKALHQDLDTSKMDHMNIAMRQLLAMFSEIERNLILERTTAGRAATEKKLGRPVALTSGQANEIKELLKQGASKRSLAAQYGVSRATIGRVERLASNAEKS